VEDLRDVRHTGGRETAFGLLGCGASLAIVGYTMDRVELPLSGNGLRATARETGARIRSPIELLGGSVLAS
jgi:hypothetical protein